MKNFIIKSCLALSLLAASACTSVKKIPINKESSAEIKGQKFTIVSKKEDFLNFSSQSFMTTFTGVFIPYGIVWIPKMNGKKQAKKYDLRDPEPLFETEISSILVKKYGMRFEKTPVMVESRDIQELAEAYKDYPYVVDIGTAGVLMYIRLDDHGFNFAANFRLIDTKQKKEISNITCEYKTPKGQYHSKEYYFNNEANNLKEEFRKSIKECLEILKSEV
jgi:hypothetical protein